MKHLDVIIIGAGAAGLMAAIEAGNRGRRVLVLDSANKVGKKILMSGGGRCNFTNLHVEPHHYLSANPHFCKSALSRYTSDHFIHLVKQHQIPFHEKSHGQLFCDNKASDIVAMLLSCCDKAHVDIRLKTEVQCISANGAGFELVLAAGERLSCQSLVVATGGLSIPTMGASPYGYQVAALFDVPILPTRAGLVPFTLQPEQKVHLSELSGVSVPCSVECNGQAFALDMLFTHRGLSGPAMLQISSYWQPGDTLSIDLDPYDQWTPYLAKRKRQEPRLRLKQCFAEALPKRVVQTLFEEDLLECELQSLSDQVLRDVQSLVKAWRIKPNGTEGYRTAEVTLGGVDTRAFSSQTMESNTVAGLYFIGEVLDVTGWLGGYNFQWAWSSGWAAGQVI
jgi:predicted Rossmann fold flavoprotein